MKQPAKNPPSDQDAAKNSEPEAKQPPPVDHLYDHHDPIPVPEAHESDTESVWALFNETAPKPKKRQTDNDGFGATEPAPLEPRQADFDAPTEYSPLLSDFDLPTRHSPLPGGSGFDDTTRSAPLRGGDFDDTTRSAPLHGDFDAPTQAAPLSKRRKPG